MERTASTNKQLENLTKLQREDHDITIRLDAKFDAYTQENRQNQSNFKDTIGEVKKSVSDLTSVVNGHDEAIQALKAADKARVDVNVDRSNRRHDVNTILVTAGTLLMAAAGVISILIATGVIR